MLESGRVVTTTRRSAHVLIDQSHDPVRVAISNQVQGVCVGDLVELNSDDNSVAFRSDLTPTSILRSIYPRKNCLFRSFGNRRKNVCANVDLALIITAPGILGNTIFIDRILCACALENIPAVLIINKSDVDDPDELLNIYQTLNMLLIVSSAHTGEGMDQIRSLLLVPTLSTVVLCGISGVGKSSIVNNLMPDVGRRIQAVSRKTGQGQQTTTQAEGFLFSRDSSNPLLVVDTPGVQNFGLSHLTEEECRHGFTDIVNLSSKCEFRDCKHIEEVNCGILDAISTGVFPISRYESYLNIIQELEQAKKYKYSINTKR
jgi:ribosome biogenesis GTPase